MLPATGVAHAAQASVPVGGTCPDVNALNANEANDPLNIPLDVQGTGTAAAPTSSLYRDSQWIGAGAYYNQGYFGQGVDVALIDSGVLPISGLDNGNVIQGPDFSFESQAAFAATPNPAVVHADTYGHGTHLAGIIAGRDDSSSALSATHVPFSYSDPGKFTGIAPGARVVNLKVADDDGATDITQVIAAVDWAVKHAHSDGLNIRVINLSYGIVTGTYDDWTTNALSYAVDQAWKAGIVVVASAGNGGKANAKLDPGLDDPGANRDIIAVGAYDNGILSGSKATVPGFSSSSSSSNTRNPDVSAPGAHIMSLHAVGSSADDEMVALCQASVTAPKDGSDPNFPNGPQPWIAPLRGNDRFMLGSGTSQATAMVSGAVALVLSRNPELTPAQVKAILRQTADPTVIANGGRGVTGEGSVNLAQALTKFSNGISGTQVQNNTTVVGGAGFNTARGYVYVSDGRTVTTSKPFIANGCDPTLNPYYPAGCITTTSPAPGALLDGDNEDIFGQSVDIGSLQRKELTVEDKCLTYTGGVCTSWTNDPRKPAAYYYAGSGPWVSIYGGEVYCPNITGCSNLWIGTKTTDAFGNPMWNAIQWPGTAWDGKPFTAYDYSGEGLTHSGWRMSDLTHSGWRGFGLNVSAWDHSGWRDSGWKHSGWRDNGWS
jgi:serine protease AprX